MNNIIIRKANISDAKSILDINVNSWKNTYKNIFPKEFLDNLCREEDYLKSLNKMVKKIEEKDCYLVAVCNNEVVGFSNFGPSKKEEYFDCGEIYALYIKNDLVKQGIGTKLFGETVNILKEDYSRIIVSCLVDNPSNKFYEKMNCKKNDECKFILEDNEYIENLYECN